MSNKKKNYNNYNKMSTEPKVEEVKEENVETVSEVEKTPKEPEVKVVYGVVANCEKLNMRSKPSKQADVICILTKGDKVEIVETKDEFYNVKFEDSKGFCMKEFIEIK